jgi:hypothetical protein
MKLDVYSSLAAFLAHWRALKQANADTLAVDDLARRAEMDAMIAALRPEERSALQAANNHARSDDDGSADVGATRRHRERAELRLARELRARGVLAT